MTQVSIVHQTRHELPLFGGMGENAPVFWPRGYEDRLADPFMRALTRASRHPDQAPSPRDLRARDTMLRGHGVRWVVLHRNLVDSELNRFARRLDPERRQRAPFEAQERLTALLGEPVAVDGPMVVWALEPVPEPPEPLRPTDRTLGERVWERPEPTPYEARLHELGRIP